MKRIVSAISFILIFAMIITASAIPAGAIILDGADNNGEWKDYEIVKTFNEDSIIEGGFIKAAKETGKDSETTVNFLIYAAFKKKDGKPEDPGVIFKFEDNGLNEIYISQGSGKLTKSDNQNYKTVAVNKYYIDGSYYCEIQAQAKDGLDEIVDLKLEFRDKPFEEDEPHKFQKAYSIEVSLNPEEATKTTAPKATTEKATKEKTTKEKTTKVTTTRETTTKPEKTTTAKATTTATTEISHRTRRTTTAKSTTEKKTEKASKAKTTKVKTTKAKTTKAKKTATKAERSLTENYSAEAAVSTTLITSAEMTAEQTTAQTVTETDKSLFGGKKLSKSSLYKLITGAVALVLFAIIGVSAVRTKSAADKADEKPFSEKQKEEEKEDKEE